ncbi:BREX-1 system adenine-specific DNA-methyltransferase PglX [Desulfococcaceae bacterium HSG9]|nr:BREX-1 system adenine-specific DNA-methyltransferase PglX [Desulfococcaceae bacterium HSG9]
MQTAKLKTFAQYARRALRKIVDDKIKFVSDPQSPARRDHPKAVTELEDRIKADGKEAVIEKAAYIWFNRFCALRFMDMNRYNRVGVLSPLEGQSQPEILAEAKMGVMDAAMIPAAAQNRIAALLSDKIPSPDPQNEAYRLLIVAVCNYWNKAMPFLFERIADYTELLMPDDLLSDNSIAVCIREAMTTDACADVEVIGWLYQFYISEKKDEVFAGLKKNRKVTPENIPAATQLFTPNWIVRYLVENSLGRLWMLNRPGSALIEKMAYYIKPEQEETDFLKISSPEEIKICDPACGSGHILVYAFEILYAVYEEEGYDAPEIPHLILKNNLYGVEIDERAGVLAAFALFMKAREKYRRFFRKAAAPNICVLEKINLGAAKNTEGGLFETANEHRWTQIVDRLCLTGADRKALLHDLRLFEEADNFGSLLKPELSADDIAKLIPAARDMEEAYLDDVFLNSVTKDVSKALKQADYLSPEYHVVIANPPYMGGKGMNPRLKKFAKDNYKNSKSDLFAMFIERGFDLIVDMGYNAMVTMQSWMFLSSYEKLRKRLMLQTSIESMVHMANMVMGIAFGTSATIWKRNGDANSKGVFCYVEYEDIGEGKKPVEFPPKNERNKGAVNDQNSDWSFRASTADFKKIPGSPIAYWVSECIRKIFDTDKIFENFATPRQGLGTTNNNLFTRFWSEVNFNKIAFGCENKDDALASNNKWFPYSKGGGFRKYYGNDIDVVNWENDGKSIRNALMGKNPNIPRSEIHYFKEGITWGLITSAKFSARYSPKGGIFDVGGSKAFPPKKSMSYFLGLLNSKLTELFLKTLNPTLNFQVGDLKRIPVKRIEVIITKIDVLINKIIKKTSSDWNSYETSWDFTTLPILQAENHKPTLKTTYTQLRTYWQKTTLEMQRLEEENNRIFIEAYGLQEELTPDVPLSEITLTCNPHYRYGGKKTDEEREALLSADTMKEFISYAAGCMFGRYSLDKPGLILADQGETIDDYLALIPEPSFKPDDENVIPITDVDWFKNDMGERFKQFLKIAFGVENYAENLAFIEKALGKDIRKYFLKNFYADHVKRYKKRPIYWMFASPKGNFNALIYMHRYRPDTVSIVLNEYLREYITKLTARKDSLEKVGISASASPREKTKALKESEKIKKVLDELNAYERKTLYPLAIKQVKIDLDDGVKVNYPKFGKALKKVVGLSR